MTHRMHVALVASLSLVALSFAAEETFARSGGAPAAAPAGGHAAPVARSLRHHRGHRVGPYWPAGGGFFYDPSAGQAAVDFSPPASRDIRYTYTYDVPWDWAHRYPPNVLPSDRAYITECPTQTVTVAGRDGREQTVNITRCY